MTTTKSNSFIVKNDTVLSIKKAGFKTLQDNHKCDSDSWYFKRLFSYKGRKFQLVCEFYNGDPCGFKYTKCVKYFHAETGEWKNIADCNTVGIRYNNEYFASDAEHRAYLKELGTAMYNYIELLYSED